jgi:hypothetical protein
MAGLDPAIHVFLLCGIPRTWMPGTSGAKTRFGLLPVHDGQLFGGLKFHAVFAAFNPSFASTASRIRNFWILPVTVIGNSSTNST